MKKIALYCTALLALAMGACDDTSDLGKMQVNPQEPVMSADGVNIEYVAPMNGATLNLDDLKGQTLNVFSYTLANDTEDQPFAFPEGSELSFKMVLEGNGSFGNRAEVALAAAPDNIFTVGADELNDAFASLFGKSPYAAEVNLSLIGYVQNGNQLVRLGGNNTVLGAKKLSVTPINLNMNVEESYYFASTLKGLTVADAVKMSHSDRYAWDDPKFSIAVDIKDTDVTNGPVEWKIVPQTLYTAGGSLNDAYGVAADAEELGGALEKGGVAGKIAAPGRYLLTVDMEKLTYTISYANDNLYVWGMGSNNQFNDINALYTSDFVTYEGVAYVKTFWALFGQKDSHGLHLGAVADTPAGELVSGNKAQPVRLTSEQPAGLYWFKVNLPSLLYEMTYIKTLCVVGGYNNWGNKTDDGKILPDVELTPDARCQVWTGEVTFPGEGKYKFRANGNDVVKEGEADHRWDISFGAGENVTENGGDLAFNAGNLSVKEAGTYKITVNFSQLPYTFTIVKK